MFDIYFDDIILIMNINSKWILNYYEIITNYYEMSM